MPKLLVVDDDLDVCKWLEQIFQSETLAVLTAGSAEQGLDLARRHHPDVAILDVILPGMSGLEACRQMHQLDPLLPIIIVSGQGSGDTAIEATKHGASVYLAKPVDEQQLRETVYKWLETRYLSGLAPGWELAEESAGGAEEIVGRCPGMFEVLQAIGRVGPQNATVLILGESGTGKELVAKALHRHSRRKGGPFLTVNCAAIPETLLESELFGHEKGAFTGADRKRIGKFEQADHGTLFLDEIGDLAAAAQAKVLRLLEQQQFERLGGNETIAADVRLIAATHRDLAQLVNDGAFRDDLFYRLNVFPLRLPPLRERRGDVPLLTKHFLHHFNRKLGKNVRYIEAEVSALLEAHSWPGNVRELQHVIESALICTAGPVLRAEVLPEHLKHKTPADLPRQPSQPDPLLGALRFAHECIQSGEVNILDKVHAVLDKVVLAMVLRRTGGNKGQAGRLLGVSRTTLRTRMRQLGLSADAAGPGFGQLGKN
jgi:DNA-binding NtrC family response regulator